MIEQTLHGLLVGLGKIRKDGSKEFHWLDKPIHNRIVSGGLDEFFMYNGSPTDSCYNYWNVYNNNRFLSDDSGQGLGLLKYMAIGTDGTATEFTDTGLKSQVGLYSNEYTYTSVPYWGTRINSDDTISLRVQRTSVAVESDTVVREIGLFEKNSSSETYYMFSRVVLPSPVDLLAGEKLTIVYQLNVTYANLSETDTPSSLLSGLLDSDGNPLRGRSSFRMVFKSNSTSGGPYTIPRDTWMLNLPSSLTGPFFGINGVNVGNNPFGQYNKYGTELGSPFLSTDRNGNRSAMLFYSIDSGYSLTLPQFAAVNNGQHPDNLVTTLDSNYMTCTVKPYTIGNYYRDIEFVLTPGFINTESYVDIYAISCNSFLTRFGYYDNTEPDNPVWVAKPWRKEFGKSYKITFRYKLTTTDTV